MLVFYFVILIIQRLTNNVSYFRVEIGIFVLDVNHFDLHVHIIVACVIVVFKEWIITVRILPCFLNFSFIFLSQISRSMGSKLCWTKISKILPTIYFLCCDPSFLFNCVSSSNFISFNFKNSNFRLIIISWVYHDDFGITGRRGLFVCSLRVFIYTYFIITLSGPYGENAQHAKV